MIGFTAINSGGPDEEETGNSHPTEEPAMDIAPQCHRTNAGDTLVSEYLGLDAMPSTKKALYTSLKDHPLAAPKRSRTSMTKINGRARKKPKVGSPTSPKTSNGMHRKISDTMQVSKVRRLFSDSDSVLQVDKEEMLFEDAPPSAQLENRDASENVICNAPRVMPATLPLPSSAIPEMDFDPPDDDLLQVSGDLDLSTLPDQGSLSCVLNEQQLPSPFPSDSPLYNSDALQPCEQNDTAADGAVAAHGADAADGADGAADGADRAEILVSEDEWNIMDDDLDPDEIGLTTTVEDKTQRGFDNDESRKVDSVSYADLEKLISTSNRPPATQTPATATQSPATGAHKPIARPPFPGPIKDCSPIFGVSVESPLRTCFRIGEALNHGCQSVRLGRPVVLELYARVMSSSRDQSTGLQNFRLHDLFHDNPPLMDRVWGVWKGSELRDQRSRKFLRPKEGGRLCRAVGKMERVHREWRMQVFDIREVQWEEVEWTAGIYCI